jgi:hypothetical protein
MGQSVFVFSFVCSVVFTIFKYFEMRVLKKSVPVKNYIRNSLIVYLSVLFANFVIEQLNPITKLSNTISVFTNNPDF